MEGWQARVEAALGEVTTHLGLLEPILEVTKSVPAESLAFVQDGIMGWSEIMLQLSLRVATSIPPEDDFDIRPGLRCRAASSSQSCKP